MQALFAVRRRIVLQAWSAAGNVFSIKGKGDIMDLMETTKHMCLIAEEDADRGLLIERAFEQLGWRPYDTLHFGWSGNN
jgi:hypothetical protein